MPKTAFVITKLAGYVRIRHKQGTISKQDTTRFM